MYTNAQKLAAVLNKWASPLVGSIVDTNLSMIPGLANIENKIKASGWVSPTWSLSKELKPLLGNATKVIVEPMILNVLDGIPDESIPKMAHTIVDNAISNGSATLLDGRINFDTNDLEELKRYLDYNLPIGDEDDYEVITNK